MVVGVWFSCSLYGQVSTGSIAGVLRDSSGAVIAGTHVALTNTENGQTRMEETGADGAFSFTTLPVGSYFLKIEKPGFAVYTQEGISLTVGQSIFLPIALTVGDVSQAVTVSADAAMVNTSDSTVARLVDERQVEGLPLNGRQPANLVFLAPGAANPILNIPSSNTGYPVLQNSLVHPLEIAPAINGMRGDGVYFSLDGVNNIDTYQVTGGPFPNPDATREFSVVTSTFGARYVSAPGGAVNIVTKSGTNEFHGNLFEFLRNGDLNARNFFAADHDNLKRNQFGGTVGGPVLKNRVFYFGSYEGTRLHDVMNGITQFVPTDAQRAGDLSGVSTPIHDPVTGMPYPNNQIPLSQFDPVTKALLPYIPQSSAPGGKIQFSQPIVQRDDQAVVKVDYVRGKNAFFGRYFLDNFAWDPVGILNGSLLVSNRGQAHRWQNGAFGYTYTGANLVSEFRAAYVRDGSTTFAGENTISLPSLGANFPKGQFPTIQSLGVAGLFSITPGNFNGFPRDTFILSENVGLMRGRHEIAFGAEIQRIRATLLTDNQQNPTVSFSGALSGNALGDFLLGRPASFGQSDGIFVRARGMLWGFYGEDKMRLSPRLTLTAGLRWDPYWPFHSLHGRMQCFRPGEQSTVFTNAPTGLLYPGDPGCNDTGTSSSLANIQPRVGLAYRFDDKGSTVLRGGYGLYTMQFPMFSFLGFGFAQPYSRLFALAAPGLISNPWASFPGGDPFTNGFGLDDLSRPGNVSFIQPVRVGSFAPDFHLGYVQQWSVTLERSVGENTVIQASYVGTKGTHLDLGADMNQPVFIPGQSTLANSQQRRPLPNISNAIELRSEGNSIYNSFQASVRHRVKAGLTVSSNFTAAKSIDDVSANGNLILSGPPNQIPIPSNPRARRGLSDFDISHSWRTSFVWQVPVHGKAFLNRIASNVELSGIWTLDAGLPFSVTAPAGNSLTATGLDNADQVAGVSPFLDPNRPRGQLIHQYFNTAAFATNAVGTFGTTGRNIIRAPGLSGLDFAATKGFPLAERLRIEFRAEFFNLANTPQFLPPVSSVGVATFGQILAARDPRILQFASKLYW
jgi:hypothetical protein